jgi:hypothetical protein
MLKIIGNFINNSSDYSNDNGANDSDSNNSDSNDSNLEQLESNDRLENYITNKIKYNTDNSEFGFIKWNGLQFIKTWELQRIINDEHVQNIVKKMEKDYIKNNNFTFYDPIHLIVDDTKEYNILDGQHRLESYKILYEKNIYPIQSIPAIIWNVSTDKQKIKLFDRINQRTLIDKKKLFRYKINDIIEGLTNKYGNILGTNRPKMKRDIFIQKMEENDNVHKLESMVIINKLIEINNKIRQLPRNMRGRCSHDIHNKAEILDFFLGYDKEMLWINDI